MRIRMKVLGAGPDGVMVPGEEYEATASAGEALIQGGYAERVPDAVDLLTEMILESPLIIESEMMDPPEKAILPKAKSRRKPA